MASLSHQQVLCNLGSYPLTLAEPGMYEVIASLTLPTIATGAASNSQVVTTISHNATVVFTGLPGAKGAQVSGLDCAAGDTITVALTSSAPIDQTLNTIKCTVAIG